MGVPAFFKWLTVRYPQVIIEAITDESLEVLYKQYKGENDDQYQQNKNPRVDNLYLDMNGIIHPCCHPIDRPQPKTQTEMFNLIFEYTDKIIDIVKPQKLIYLAIDGVAPRAKMNQQRSRRFRTALDAEEKAERTNSIKFKWAQEGIKFQEDNTADGFDSNVITPGTSFMHDLSKALQLYIVQRQHSSEYWADLQIIFSDAFVPGEGEHKILDFIRAQRAQPMYNVNTSHCIHGADADLIMLGLSTHDPHFFILREIPEETGPQHHKGGPNNSNDHRSKSKGNRNQQVVQEEDQQAKTVKFQFVKLSVVREYLFHEFKNIKIPFNFDFEKIIDDFIFLCFFVGNDFLPHLPSLSIREGALDAILFIYKNLLPSLGNYLTDGAGGLNFQQVDVLMRDLSRVEEEFFRQHQKNAQINDNRRKNDDQREKMQFEREKQMKLEQFKQDRAENDNDQLSEFELKQLTVEQFEKYQKSQVLDKIYSRTDLNDEEKQKEASKQLKEIVSKEMNEKQKAQVEAYEDKVQLTREGWKERYYLQKFHVQGESEMKMFCANIRQSYIEGLSWVFSYYLKGCQSWYWYYPYHYAPFASDLMGCDQIKIKFEKGEPAKPFEQLLAVFPKQSSHALPKCYQKLYQHDSEIIDFYPRGVKLDINGARYAWMGVNLLPFIDRQRLRDAMIKADQNEENLTPSERTRNKVTGPVRLYFQSTENNKKSKLVKKLLESKDKNDDINVKAGFEFSDLISGQILLPNKSNELEEKLFQYGKQINKKCGELEINVKFSNTFCVHYTLPSFEKHESIIFEGVQMPAQEIEEFAVYSINRRHFQGEEAIRIVEKVLGIDASVDPVYSFSSQANAHKRNFNGQSYGNYQNNHATYEGVKPKHQHSDQNNSKTYDSQPPHLSGHRRTYETFSHGQQTNQTYNNPQKYFRDNSGYRHAAHQQDHFEPRYQPQQSYQVQQNQFQPQVYRGFQRYEYGAQQNQAYNTAESWLQGGKQINYNIHGQINNVLNQFNQQNPNQQNRNDPRQFKKQ